MGGRRGERVHLLSILAVICPLTLAEAFMPMTLHMPTASLSGQSRIKQSHIGRSALHARNGFSLSLKRNSRGLSMTAEGRMGEMPPVKVLERACAAAKEAVELSTGKGTESSGSGRYEWGTWCDTDLFQKVRDATDSIGLRGSPELWPALWAVVGGEKTSGKMLVAKGKDWFCYLHIFLTENNAGNVEKYRASNPTGSLALFKPLLGQTTMTKMRTFPDGRCVALGSPISLKGTGASGAAFGGTKVENAQLLLGGPLTEMASASGPSALLELCMLPPMGLPDRDDTGVPWLPFDNKIIADSFVDLSADAPPPPPPPPPPEEKAATKGVRNAALETATTLSNNVGGLEAQLDSIVRRVLASRADPKAARTLGISHVRGILLSGPPGCGKTLLARELARSLGAREPQVVNGPEILDKFVGEAEKRVRELFEPAESEWASAGDSSALHVIILDEMDSIARKRGSLGGDTSGVRDSVVNQLLSKMDGVNQAENFLVVGLTNRPELLDEALLRPGRLEVHLKVELPDLSGRRDILRIHTRAMRAAHALAEDASHFIDDLGEMGLSAKAEHFSGAELAGLVRSAASFSLARSVLDGSSATVTKADLTNALSEVVPASGKRDETLQMRYAAHGVAPPSQAHAMLMRELKRFVTPSAPRGPPRVQSILLSAAGHGAGVTALGAWAAALASKKETVDYARLLTSADMMGSDDASRVGSLVEAFTEARAMSRAVLVLDDIDRMVAGVGAGGASSTILGTLRALLREPLPVSSQPANKPPPCMLVIATSSDPSAACKSLQGIFDTTHIVPLIQSKEEAASALRASTSLQIHADAIESCAAAAVKYGPLGVKDLMTLAERACAAAAAAAATEDEDEWGMREEWPASEAGKQIYAFEAYVADRQRGITISQGACQVF